ncbi:hypothetical protein [Pseudomonas orientalis]|uniref:hypothetical protein n=1 Tax=Pseudomonas orientalis TaxID=76758 RepID=UPI00197FB563|nr:hypothetical protein [Pseudomonas orientalis]
MKNTSLNKYIKPAAFLGAIGLSSLSFNVHAALCSEFSIPANSWSVMGDPKSNIVLITYNELFFGPDPFTTPSNTFNYQGITYTRGALITTCRTGPSVFDYDVSYYYVSGPSVTPPAPPTQPTPPPAPPAPTPPPPPVVQSTGSESRGYSCPAGQTGTITQARTYEVWSDGSVRNYSAWNISGNSCTANPITVNPSKRAELCQAGYTGKITYKWVVYYTNDNYSATDADGRIITYTLSTPHQQEILESNSCTLIPTQQVSTKPGNETMSCDAYYNSVKGTYIGTVYKYGNYVSGYDSNTKQTNTVFNVTSVDVTQCKADSDKTIKNDSYSAACPAGQNGSIVLNRTYAIDKSGNVTYPFGTSYTQVSNTCSSVAIAETTANVVPQAKTSLISNLSLKTSMLADSIKSKQIVDMLKSQNIKAGEMHKFNLVIDDLTAGKYSVFNTSQVITSFKSAVGQNADINLVLPSSLDKFVGNGGLTDVKNKTLTSVTLNESNKLVVKYIEVLPSQSMTMPVEREIIVPIFDSSLSSFNFK